MPIRAIVIMLVVAVVFAVCYRDQIYKWFKNAVSEKQSEEHADEESEEEKEKKD